MRRAVRDSAAPMSYLSEHDGVHRCSAPLETTHLTQVDGDATTAGDVWASCWPCHSRWRSHANIRCHGDWASGDVAAVGDVTSGGDVTAVLELLLAMSVSRQLANPQRVVRLGLNLHVSGGVARDDLHHLNRHTWFQ